MKDGVKIIKIKLFDNRLKFSCELNHGLSDYDFVKYVSQCGLLWSVFRWSVLSASLYDNKLYLHLMTFFNS